MSTAKVEVNLGGIVFSGEGEEKWVASQLDKVLDKAPDLLRRAHIEAPASFGSNGAAHTNGNGNGNGNGNFDTTLAKYLQDHNANTNQVKRFLATAEWLTKKGNSRPATKEITKALRDAHQPRLGNPADCLNKNVTKGYCEKDGGQFFVTPDGRKSLGE